MSNYLNNLIARNQQATEVVRPRLPSVFEPPPAAMLNAFASPHLVAPLETEQSPADATGREPQGPAEALGVTRITEPLAPPIPAWRGLQVTHDANAASDAPTALENISRKPATAPHTALERDGAGRLTGAVSPKADDAHAEGHLVEREARRGNESLPRTTASRHDEATANASRARHEPQTTVRPFSQSDRPSDWPTPAHVERAVSRESNDAALANDAGGERVVVRPRVAAHTRAAHDDVNSNERGGHRPRREPLAAQPAAPQTPTINVTIGRIEVRAVTPAAAPPQPRKPAPSLMSLDEYMRRRNAGGDSR
ncbi:MAG TPA: hypothetical protein VJZ91_05745 [Blastocatellia bacterium]|nr:hypothetical protein [Blastocatellia bacterium]